MARALKQKMTITLKIFRGEQKPFKINHRRLKMKKWFSGKKWSLYWKNTVKSNFSRQVDIERITIGSFLAHRFGLRIFVRGVFLKRVRKMLAMTFLIFGIFMKFEVFGVRNYEIGV